MAKHGAQLGAEVPLPLDLLEMGLNPEMRATVVANEPCPQLQRGPGRLVLTTVNHLNADLRELVVRDAYGKRQTIRPTGLHKFYSATRDDWISAGDLREGERLQGASGPVTVVSVATVPGVHRVYNMSVEEEHVYRVSPLGVLVHNPGCSPPVPVPGGDVPNPGLYKSGNATGPYPLRLPENVKPGQLPDIIPDAQGMVHPGSGGSSAFSPLETLPTKGKVWYLPPDAPIPPELRIVYDPPPDGHHTIGPASSMTMDEFLKWYYTLPWVKTPHKF